MLSNLFGSALGATEAPTSEIATPAPPNFSATTTASAGLFGLLGQQGGNQAGANDPFSSLLKLFSLAPPAPAPEAGTPAATLATAAPWTPPPPVTQPPPTTTTSTPEPDICVLPPLTGNCQRARIMWYFDNETRACERFSFSGCGNSNRFESKRACEARCLRLV
ncbi:unnamed protein product, partial [Mesorhabditis spiculigera]